MPDRRGLPGLCFPDICDESCEGYGLFTDLEALEKEKNSERAAPGITARFGKNALIRGTSLRGKATARERNLLIGGHRAGYDDTFRKS